jgi:hypothetical protein
MVSRPNFERDLIRGRAKIRSSFNQDARYQGSVGN